MKNRSARRGLLGAAITFFALAASTAHAEWALNMPEGVTILSKKIYSLHMLILWVCVGIAVVVFGAMIFSMIKFRRSKGAEPDKTMVHSTKVEIVWTVIPILILVGMAVPIAKTLIEIEDMGQVDVNIKVTGYQWKWEYEYLGQNVSFFSTLKRDSDAARQLNSGTDPNTVENYLLDVDNVLVIPAGQKVRFLLTAQDVIHAWWVPDFGMKKDAIPGYVNEIWVHVDADKTGIYRGQCAELCGRDHGFMPIVVEVKSPADYDAWLRAKQAEQKLAGVAPDAPAVTAAATAPAIAQ
ncbi:MAG TPA: cytochrome c oxidase subunit II [Steroidobacteraceae bacterium]|jgi:cytochrome c oxidase subunit 2|nr:cytochrome c oxidase subunit II [Steroidobacteraceae bacterium]